ncbi:TonB-dependent receptor [Sphingobium sp. TomTYG75]
MKKYLKRNLMLCCAASALALPTVAHAQDQGASPTTPSQTRTEGLGAVTTTDIVVTATRVARNLSDVPMSVNVATGEQLEKLQLFDTKDVQQLAPGLELTNTSGRNNTTTLRGLSFDPDSGVTPTVQTYVNEVPADAQTVFTALYDIGQIEILRGPQGLERGLPSPAGAITITTRRPVFDEITGYAQASATDDKGYNFQGGVNLPFSDKFAIRVAGLVDHNQVNQVRNISNGDRSRATTMSGRITLGFKPSDAFTAYLTYQYLEADTRQYTQVVGTGSTGLAGTSGPALGVDDYASVMEGPARFKNRSHQITFNGHWDMGPVSLDGLAAYQYSKLGQARDQDTTNAIPGYVAVQRIETPFKIPTFELRLSTNDDGSLGGGIGAFYTKQTGTTRVDQPADNFFTAFAPASLGLFLPIGVNVIIPADVETLSFNAFGHARLGNLKIEGGLRYTKYHNILVSDTFVSSPGYPGFAPFGIDPIDPFTVNQDGIPAALRDQGTHAFTGGVNLTYEVNDALNIYASYNRSFRAPTAGASVPVGLSNDLIVTDDEKTDAFEVGVKGSAFDRKLNFAFAAFYQKIDGFVSRFTGVTYDCPNLPAAFGGGCDNVPPASPVGTPGDRVNDGGFDFNYNGDATVKGVELTLDAHPTTFWDFSVSTAYVKARYSKGARLPCNDYNGDGAPDSEGTPAITGPGNVSFCKLGRLSDTPNFSLSANSELRFPMGGSFTPFVRGLINYRPAVFSQLRNFNYQSRTILNVYAGVRSDDSKWELTGFIKNLINQKRITDISAAIGQTAAADGSVFDSGYRTINATAPREFGASLAFRW